MKIYYINSVAKAVHILKNVNFFGVKRFNDCVHFDAIC